MSSVTIRKIAEKTGVSPSTVYRALSGDNSVSVENRRRIIACAYANHYTLPGHYCRNIAILVPHFKFYGYLGSMLAYLEKALHDKNYRIQLIPESDLAVLGDHMFDGIITMVWLEGDVLTLPREYDIPIVSLNAAFSALENISLVASEKNGILKALIYLKQHGCRRIFFVGTLTDKNPIESERLECFRQFCSDNSLNFDIMHRSVCAADVESVLPNILAAEADGVFCASETYSFRIGNAMQKNGIIIPRDISLMGLEAEELNTSFKPAITAIRQDFEKLAESTVKVLTQAIEKHYPVQNIRVPYTLVERESVKSIF